MSEITSTTTTMDSFQYTASNLYTWHFPSLHFLGFTQRDTNQSWQPFLRKRVENDTMGTQRRFHDFTIQLGEYMIASLVWMASGGTSSLCVATLEWPSWPALAGRVRLRLYDCFSFCSFIGWIFGAAFPSRFLDYEFEYRY